MAWAIVTGASAGIGRDISLELAGRGYDMVLVARRQDRLQELAEEIHKSHGVESLVVAADLTQADGCRSVFTACGDREVEVLVNNAGFGLRQSFVKADLQKQLEMVRLNIEAVVHLTGLFAPAMLQRGRGRVLNLGSSAAFQPGPHMAVYYASKAFVVSLSEALAHEFSAQGVTVTAYCPGPTESEFGDLAGNGTSRAFKLSSAAPSAEVAAAAVKATLAGRSTVVHGALMKLTALSTRFAPLRLTRTLAAWVNEDG